MNLYEINSEICNLVDTETGEVMDFEKFSELNIALEEKKENIALFVKNLKAEAGAIDEEIKNLTERKNTKTAQAERLSEYLSNFLNGERFETAKVSCSFRKSTRCEVEDEADFLKNYPSFGKPQPPKLDKAELKNALKGGKHYAGAALIDKYNLQIK